MREIVAQQCSLLEVATYFVTELTRAGVCCRYVGTAEPAPDALQCQIEITTPKTWSLWIRLHRGGAYCGQAEVTSYSDPFVVADLHTVGPGIVSRVLEDCRELLPR